MIKVLISDLSKTLLRFAKADIPVMVYGAPGVGKSMVMLQASQEACTGYVGRKHVHWNNLTEGEKLECTESPEKYFVYFDMRLSQAEPSSISGIPNMNSKSLDFIPWSWATYFINPKAAGWMFFDEINLAPPAIAAAAYQIIHDRVVSDRRLSRDVRIFAAGNRTEDKAFTFDMPMPLRDRFAEVEAVLDVDGWLNWARSSGVNTHLCQFINWKNGYLYTLDKVNKSADKASTPRGVVRASALLEGFSDIDEEGVYSALSAAVGESFANEFNAYIKLYQSIDWDKLLDNPDAAMKNMQSDVLYAVIGGLCDRLTKEVTQLNANKIKKEELKMPGKILEISRTLYNVKRHDMGGVLMMLATKTTNGNCIAWAQRNDPKLVKDVLTMYGKIITSANK